MQAIPARRALAMPRSLIVTAGLLLAALSGPSFADADNKLWRAECGVCHIAYPPGLLPERSWRALMDGLDHHFGANASLDAAQRKEIAGFLAANAGQERRGVVGQPPLRITELAWFEREHDELPAGVWKRKEVGSRANCAACHRGADKGRFDEHDVVVPGSSRRRG